MGCAIRKDEKEKSNSEPNSPNRRSNVYREANGKNGESSADIIRESFLKGQLKLDSRCPLDERQLYSLLKSWKAINRNMSVTSINMFIRLFETNHDIQQMFSNFKDFKSIADLRNSKVLEGHAMKVFCTIDDTIVNFDDMDYVLKMLEMVAQAHSHRFPNFDPGFFWRVEEPFILAVKEELGDRFTISIERTYRETIRFIVGTLAREFVNSRQKATAFNGQAAIQADSYGDVPKGKINGV